MSLSSIYQLSLYPLSRYVLPLIPTREQAIVFHITAGLSIFTVLFEEDILFAVLMAVAAYFIIDKSPISAVFFAFAMNSISHVLYIFTDIKVVKLTMIIFLKVVSISFNISDGKKIQKGEKPKNEFVERFHLKEKPNFAEWFAYCFTPFGSISAPFYEYKLFDYLLSFGENPTRASQKSKDQALQLYKQAFCYFIVFEILNNYFEFSFFQSESFLSANIIIRIIYILVLSFLYMSKNLFHWDFNGAPLFECGFGDSGFAEECDFFNSTLVRLCKCTTISEWSKTFNQTISLFWKKYFSERISEFGPDKVRSEKIVNAIKTYYKGIFNGYYFSNIEKKLYVRAETFLRGSALKGVGSEIPFLIYTQVMMFFSKATIRFKSIKAFFYMHYTVRFIFWIIPSIMVAYDNYIVKPKKEIKEDIKPAEEKIKIE